jgi:hypothetical protein
MLPTSNYAGSARGSKEYLGGFAVVDVADEEAAAVGRKDRGDLRLAAGGATLPEPDATFRDFVAEPSRYRHRGLRRGGRSG